MPRYNPSASSQSSSSGQTSLTTSDRNSRLAEAARPLSDKAMNAWGWMPLHPNNQVIVLRDQLLDNITTLDGFRRTEEPDVESILSAAKTVNAIALLIQQHRLDHSEMWSTSDFTPQVQEELSKSLAGVHEEMIRTEEALRSEPEFRIVVTEV